ncbi:MAG TPA: glycosyltransferase family 39 protein [Mycobacteriales bacterium]|nr:glycosyltransferase family 39 protein [Mycobacteriales bacterium]
MTSAQPRSPFAWRGVLLIAGAVTLVLFALSGRYGYHRDELYFLACGRHLAWGYPDQPPLVPLLARAMSGIAPGSLVLLRLPSDLAAGGTVVLTAAIARELGAGRGGQLLAAGTMAASGFLLGSGHLLSTTTFGLTLWAGLILCALRLIRTGDGRWWLAAGLVTGIGLLDNVLIVFLAVTVMVGVAVLGPRPIFRSGWLLVGVVIAAALWTPYLVWQAQHGWPELTIGRAIANGSSGTSAPRWQIPVQQFLLASPLLAPIWIAGLVRLCRGEALRWCRAFGVAYFLLLVIFLVTGGKPYYLANMFPLLLAAGAEPALDWARQSADHRRLLRIAVVFSAIPDALITLPIVPVGSLHQTPIVAMNYDAGETVAWPTYVRQVSAVADRLPQRQGVAIVTSNYGEAGALQRYGSARLPPVFGRQNAYYLWGPPPASVSTVVAVGFDRADLTGRFASVQLVRRLNNQLDVDDDEQDAPVWICRQPTAPWPRLWRRLRRYG